jgi:hypothetical protein
MFHFEEARKVLLNFYPSSQFLHLSFVVLCSGLENTGGYKLPTVYATIMIGNEEVQIFRIVGKYSLSVL